MKCTIPEISWHNREPVLSVDIFPESGSSYRLASGGGDCHVLIWQMSIASNGAVNQELISDLTRHQKAVNCVRWSPSGKYLATGDDDANIIIWQLKTDNIPLLEGDTEDKETWLIFKVMRGHKEDVYDICWSVDETKILSGSVDNTAILWDVHKGKMDHILTDHKGFVQGVAWDPKNQCIASIGTDRICRIFDCHGKQVKARIQKGKLTSLPDNHFLKDKEVKYFHDDTFKSFFRRLQFTPDGSLLIVPSGHLEIDPKVLNATLVFTLDNLTSPAIILPIPRQSSTVVRCNPTLYELREQGPPPAVKLPYRMIFAVGTDRDIILYDTQQKLPIARFQDIHYTRLTDLTWSQDGLLLVASSTDGFCSLITFDGGELGVPWTKLESEGEVSGCEELQEKDENVDINNEIKKEEGKKRSSFLEQWALKTPKKRKVDVQEPGTSKSEEYKEDIRKFPVDKEKINVLVAKKKPSCPITSSPSGPRIIESTNAKIDLNLVANNAKIEEGYSNKRASADIKAFFSTKPDKVDNNSKAKPIAVRRKPKNDKNTGVKKNKDITINCDKDGGKKEAEATILIDSEEETTPKKSKVANKKPTNTLLNFLQSTEKSTKNKEVITIEDDETEDFCLQLEESQDGCPEKESQPEIKVAPKTPRRVPLITLASPSSKTKKKL